MKWIAFCIRLAACVSVGVETGMAVLSIQRGVWWIAPICLVMAVWTIHAVRVELRAWLEREGRQP